VLESSERLGPGVQNFQRAKFNHLSMPADLQFLPTFLLPNASRHSPGISHKVWSRYTLTRRLSCSHSLSAHQNTTGNIFSSEKPLSFRHRSVIHALADRIQHNLKINPRPTGNMLAGRVLGPLCACKHAENCWFTQKLGASCESLTNSHFNEPFVVMVKLFSLRATTVRWSLFEAVPLNIFRRGSLPLNALMFGQGRSFV